MRPKPLSEQVIVITGASSGIGLATARMAAQRGARLVLAARNDEVLHRLEDEIVATGGEAVAVIADVGAQEDVRRIAMKAMERFGGFDTWVNNAGVSSYGTLEQVPLADQRRLFDTTYWGVVHGSLEAVPHLKQRGGTLINIGSIVSDRAVPLQGPYSAAKHAVKGFTDALRTELEMERAPVSVTLIKPASIDTPYPQHAKNFLDAEPRNPAPVYAPELVAEAILYAAEHPMRDLYVGGGAKLLSITSTLAPRFVDRMMARRVPAMTRTSEQSEPLSHNSLYDPGEDGQIHGGHPHVLKRSLYTRVAMHRGLTAALTVSAGLLIVGAVLGRRASAAQQERNRAPASTPDLDELPPYPPATASAGL